MYEDYKKPKLNINNNISLSKSLMLSTILYDQVLAPDVIKLD